jgi:hypothetical protein
MNRQAKRCSILRTALPNRQEGNGFDSDMDVNLILRTQMGEEATGTLEYPRWCNCPVYTVYLTIYTINRYRMLTMQQKIMCL